MRHLPDSSLSITTSLAAYTPDIAHLAPLVKEVRAWIQFGVAQSEVPICAFFANVFDAW
jgi:hypothetical protein